MVKKIRLFGCMCFYLVMMGLSASLCYACWIISKGAWSAPMPWYSTQILLAFPLAVAFASGLLITGGRVLFFSRGLLHAPDRH